MPQLGWWWWWWWWEGKAKYVMRIPCVYRVAPKGVPLQLEPKRVCHCRYLDGNAPIFCMNMDQQHKPVLVGADKYKGREEPFVGLGQTGVLYCTILFKSAGRDAYCHPMPRCPPNRFEQPMMTMQGLKARPPPCPRVPCPFHVFPWFGMTAPELVLTKDAKT